jgi:hypothetical protein
VSAVCDNSFVDHERASYLRNYSLENVENVHNFSVNYVFKIVLQDPACRIYPSLDCVFIR